jgi:Uncharacterized protein conserved in bacteria (DUF2125)
MFQTRTLFTASLLATLLGTAAHALTADQLWSRWTETAAAAGLSLSADGNAADGPVMTLTNVTLRPTLPKSADDPTGTIAEITLTENADGSVAIALSPEFTMPLSGDGPTGGLTVSHQGFGLTASDADGAVTYDFAGDALNVAFDMAAPMDTGDGTEPQSAGVKVNVSMTAPNGTYSDTQPDKRNIALVLNAASIGYGVNTKTAPDMSSDSSTEIADVALKLNAVIPGAARLEDIKGAGDISALLKDGLAVTLEMTQGNATGTSKEVNPFLAYDLATNSLPGSAKMSLDQTGFSIVADGQGGELTATSEMLPVPVKMTMGQIAMAFAMPMSGTESQDFRYMIKADSVAVNEEAWALIDAGKTLPRDPMRLEIDAVGKATMDLFMLAGAEAAGMTGVTPPSIESLDLKSLALSVAGAALSGSGSFTFDNATGTPVPTGTADLKVDGVNGLMDKLVALGLLPQDQADQGRMMMGMFLKPGDGEDSLVTQVEAKDGGIFVNGMQVQ